MKKWAKRSLIVILTTICVISLACNIILVRENKQLNSNNDELEGEIERICQEYEFQQKNFEWLQEGYKPELFGE